MTDEVSVRIRTRYVCEVGAREVEPTENSQAHQSLTRVQPVYNEGTFLAFLPDLWVRIFMKLLILKGYFLVCA